MLELSESAMHYSTIGDDDIPERWDRQKKARKMLPKADPEGCDEAGALGRFMQFSGLQQINVAGEDLMADFLSTLSPTIMRSLLYWAAASQENHIMESQLQGFMVGKLHKVML
jgi:hypothetical protein